jgi:hypothetical protein
MFEWIQTLREFLPDPALAALASLAVFLVLEAIVMGLARAAYRRSDDYVRDQWRKSRHWHAYRAVEYQRVGHEKANLPTLERLRELESLDRMVPGCLTHTAACPCRCGAPPDASQPGVCV